MKDKWRLPLILLLAFLLTACGAAPEKESGDAVVVGFSQLGAESSWRMANTASIEQAAAQYGFGLMMDNANQKQEKQIAAIRSFIAYRVDVIVFSPIVETGWDNVLREARQAGVPVILVDRMIETADDSLYTAYIGADFYAEGRRAGEYLIRKADALQAEHLNIVEVSGTIDSTPMRERQRGFMDVIQDDPRFTVIASVSGDFLRSKGEEVITGLLEQYGAEGFDVIYSHNDSMTLGILDVLDRQGIQPGTDMLLISVDGEKEAVSALKQGRINCIVQCTPYLGGSVMSLVQALKDGRPVPKVSHPVESAYTDFDDLSDPAMEGF
ncbi:MAG: ABC transporter substrate-binding protein [Clostridia bacterium]|nr:ABC transporter substrate-binding protein [Clostridia bacterium]